MTGHIGMIFCRFKPQFNVGVMLHGQTKTQMSKIMFGLCSESFSRKGEWNEHEPNDLKKPKIGSWKC